MRQTLVLGLDGATYTVLGPLMEGGHLPNLSALGTDGVEGSLGSTIPPVTGPAWLSLATGLSPGSTGVYDFIRRVPDADGYDFEYLDSGLYEGRAVWDLLDDVGERVGVVDYPTLSPPYEVDGFMVSGGLGASETKTHPPDLEARLSGLPTVDSHIDIGDEAYDDLEQFLEVITENLRARAQRLEYLMEQEAWDFCWAVLQEPDWFQHRMWHCFDGDHPASAAVGEHERQLFVDFWQSVDDVVGRCRELLGEDGNLVVLSDHGFGPMEDRAFRVNTWLKQEGYLVPKTGGSSHFWVKKRLWWALSSIASAIDLSERAPRLFRWGKNELSSMAIELNSIDLDESTAFDPGHIQSMGGLYINDLVVTDPADRSALLTEIRDKLRDFAREESLDLETYTPEELYGHRAPGSPDLVVRIPGVNLENGDWDEPVMGSRPERLSHQTGSHRRDGIFIAAGPDFVDGALDGARLWDVAPTILQLAECPIPTAMDGQVLTDALASPGAVRYSDDRPLEHDAEDRLTDEETAAMHEQLSDLGYFEN